MEKIQSTGRLLDYKDFRKYSDTLIETGSGHGGGIQRALDAGFRSIVSIEAKPENYEICMERFLPDPRIVLLLGESVNVLPEVLDIFRQRVVFFLDAHPSGPRSYGHKELMEGNRDFAQDTIIRKELGILLESPYKHVFILDDINGHAIASDYVQMIADKRENYKFFFYDENPGTFYKDKLLVAVPE